jgi:hypothetical protein
MRAILRLPQSERTTGGVGGVGVALPSKCGEVVHCGVTLADRPQREGVQQI